MTISGDGTEIHWKVRDLLDGHRPEPITRYALQKESGVAMNTVRAMYDNASKGVEFATLARVVAALRKLTGNPELGIGDVLEVAQETKFYGDADRPAFDASHLKPFSFQPRATRPQALRPSEEMVSELRDRK